MIVFFSPEQEVKQTHSNGGAYTSSVPAFNQDRKITVPFTTRKSPCPEYSFQMYLTYINAISADNN